MAYPRQSFNFTKVFQLFKKRDFFFRIKRGYSQTYDLATHSDFMHYVEKFFCQLTLFSLVEVWNLILFSVLNLVMKVASLHISDSTYKQNHTIRAVVSEI